MGLLSKEEIRLSKKNGIRSAWSNEAFELWYYLHFQYLDTAIDRRDYIAKLENEIKRHPGHEQFRYEKNAPGFYRILTLFGNEELAKKRAVTLRKKFKGNTDYSKHKPCTMVDILVEELENPERLLK